MTGSGRTGCKGCRCVHVRVRYASQHPSEYSDNAKLLDYVLKRDGMKIKFIRRDGLLCKICIAFYFFRIRNLKRFEENGRYFLWIHMAEAGVVELALYVIDRRYGSILEISTAVRLLGGPIHARVFLDLPRKKYLSIENGDIPPGEGGVPVFVRTAVFASNFCLATPQGGKRRLFADGVY